MPSRKELVAYGRSTDAIAEAIGADLVIFQTLPDLVESVRQFNPSITQFDCSVFTGEYVTGGVDEGYLTTLENTRADNMKNKVVAGGLGPMEGKGGGAAADASQVNGMNGLARSEEAADLTTSSAVHTNGDDTVGLHNSWKL